MAIGIANTKLGQIRGVPQEGKYAGNVVFKKVPYAEAPVGENRWKPTVPKKPWDGVYDSTAYADAPYQSYCEVAPYLKDFYYVPSPGQNEDCLYLSVTTGAESPQERRPVYIWFHGGGLSTGYYFETEFDGNELANKGIVVVSVGQRLNTFGYLSLPQLTKEQGKSGNYGFMDQIEAVKWVKDNIAAFGGDPDNITVGGQSGGSQKVCAMAGSPVSNKLFQRCIPHSGLKWLQKFPSQAEAEKAGTAFLEACGIDPSLPLEELRLLPPTAFRPKNGTGLPGSMVCDGELVPFPVMKDALEAYAGDIGFLCGTCLGESDVQAEKPFTTAAEFHAHFRKVLGSLYDKYDFANLMDVADADAWRTARVLATQGLTGAGRTNFSRNLMVDRLFASRMRESHPAFQSYTFLFSHFLPMRPEDKGTGYDSEKNMAYHSSDLFFAFASFRENLPPTRPWTKTDFALADRMSSYFANFMKTGDPNGEGLPAWKDSADGSYMEFADEPVPHDGCSGKLDALAAEFVHREYDI